MTIEPWHVISNNVVCGTSKCSDQPAHTRSLIRAFESRLNIMTVKLLTENHLDFLRAPQSLFMSKYHIVVNLMSRLNFKSVALTTPQRGK